MVAGFSPTSMPTRSRSDALPLKGCTATDAEAPALALEPEDPASGRRSSAATRSVRCRFPSFRAATSAERAARCAERCSPSVPSSASSSAPPAAPEAAAPAAAGEGLAATRGMLTRILHVSEHESIKAYASCVGKDISLSTSEVRARREGRLKP